MPIKVYKHKRSHKNLALHKILKGINKMTTKFDELQEQVNEVTSKLTEMSKALEDLSTDSQAAFTALQAKIEQGGTSPDLTPLVEELGTNVAKLTSISDAIKELDSKAEGISGAQTPPSEAAPAEPEAPSGE